MKITAGVVVRNEALTLEKSIISIEPYVDEIVVVEDNSIDGSLEILKKLEISNPKIKVLHCGEVSRLADARNLIDDVANGDWIIWWDADFIAFGNNDAPERNFSNLIDLIHKNQIANQILYGGPNAGPVINKTLKSKMYQGVSGDTQVTRKGFMRFKVGDYIDTRYYTTAPITAYHNKVGDPFFFVHLDKIKPMGRIILRDILYRFEVDQPSAVSNLSNIRSWIRNNKNEFTFQGAKNYILREYSKDLTDYKFGFLPSILDGFEPLELYKLLNEKVEYEPIIEIDKPYMPYFI